MIGYIIRDRCSNDFEKLRFSKLLQKPSYLLLVMKVVIRPTNSTSLTVNSSSSVSVRVSVRVRVRVRVIQGYG